MRALLLIVCFALIAFSCTKVTNQIPQAKLTCLHIIDQNGFTETIASKDRLENYKNVDFLSPQPFQKVMQVFSRDENGSQKSFITSYYSNGFLRQYLECVNNRAYGKYEELDSNGNLRVESKIVGGIADLSQEAEKSFIFDGQCKAYDREGRISAIISYKNGDLEGDSITYYPSGKLQKITSFKNNLKDGLCASYHENGNLVEETFYKEGKKEGYSSIFFDGLLLMSKELYHFDELIEGYYYTKDATLVSEIKDGYGFKSFFENERLLEKHQYKKGFQEGIVEVYGKKGELIKQYYIKDGFKNGEEIIYAFDVNYDRPIKKLSLQWVEGCIQGKVKTWYDNGNIEAEIEISSNKKNGTHTAWYKNGGLMFIEEYSQDLLISGQYFKPQTFIPQSKVINGNGIATLYDGNGVFMKKITYKDSKASS
jgi:antitoxin component YwqK of YwqJK toxin-antitoxin module